jgi:CarboxypepD_reg-like domain
MIKPFTIIVLLLLFSNFLFAQNKITGTVLKKTNEPIEDASVVLIKKNTTQISAFAITNSKGFFEIIYDGEIDSVTIKVSIIGYETKAQSILNKTQSLEFILVEQATELPTVLVKEKPITQQGDTTNYLVKTFTDKQDRVIGDVIAKLPGVDIDENSGQIKFNGKAISHYYIDGLDLLDKKYNIANRNIPADLVDQVQLLNNHQDIRLFDSIIRGTEPALNIKLKKKAKNKLIGKTKIGLGIAPLLWDNEITGLQFNPAFQLITTYKNNNAGNLLANELSDNYTIQKVGENREKNIKEEIINKLNTQQSNISTKRYLFNNTHLLHFNVLKVLPNKAQVKFNLSYLNDNTTNENTLQSTYILPNLQQVNFTENRKSFINTNKVEGNAIYTVNNKKVYLKNTSKAKLDFTKESSSTINPTLVIQNLQNPFYEYSNDFLVHLPVKKKIISLNSKINFNRMPQQLGVVPGQFKDVLNQSVNYEQLSQRAILNNFNTDNSISFFSKIGKINEQIKIGTELIYKKLETTINKLYKQNEYQLNDTFKNNINWNNVRIYAENETTIRKGKKQLDISFPIELNLLRIENTIRTYKTASNNIFFNPNISLNFPIVENITGDVSYTLQNSIGNVSNISSGYIINNYRSVNRNDSLVPLQKQQSVIVSLYYKNSLKAIFSNVSVSLSQTKKNIIFNQVFNGFFIQSIGNYLNNYQKSLIVSGNTSKYFIESKINLSLNYNYSTFQSDILQQNTIAKSNSKILSLGLKSNLNMLSYASIETNTKYDFFQNKITQSSFSSSPSITNRLQQFVRLYFYLSKKSTLYFNNELYNVWDDKNNKGNYFFGDMGLKQKFKRVELEIEWSNITNSKTYVTINNSENLKQINTYNIRPTNLMIKLYFNF